MTSAVDFHFDPMCSFAFQTSLWIRDVRSQLGIDVNWRFFSLEEINREDGKKHPWERDWSYGWSLMRIGGLLGRTANPQAGAFAGGFWLGFVAMRRSWMRHWMIRPPTTRSASTISGWSTP